MALEVVNQVNAAIKTLREEERIFCFRSAKAGLAANGAGRWRLCLLQMQEQPKKK